MANTGSYSMCMRGTDEAIEELRALLNSDAFRSSVAIGRDPFITCYPTLTDDIKAFGHPKLDQDQELVPLNERSILDCGENTKTRLRCPRMSVLPASIPIARFT